MASSDTNPTAFWPSLKLAREKSVARTDQKPVPQPYWPLMGDITGSRGGVPEILIQWRRAQGEEDPTPRL